VNSAVRLFRVKIGANLIEMRKYVFVLIFTLLLAATIILAQTKNSPIFRTITVGAGDRTISLGGEISKVGDLLVKTETGYTLKPNAFGGAEIINILLTRESRVRAMFFEYEAGKDFEKTVASYTQSLGKPSSRQSFASQALQAEVVAWEDAETRFELVKRTEQEKTFVFSALFNRKGAGK
jgi:hypothetical protein